LNDFLLINKPEEEFSASDFLRILISGFKEANFAQIPASLDAVSLSEMGMVQAKNYKNVFIIGASSSNLPQISNTPGFLTSENLAQISSADTDNALEDRQELANLDQDYQFGACLTLASNWVYVSYPFLNTANESIQPSTYYTKLQELGARELEQADLPKEDASDILSFTTNAKASLGYLTNLSPAYQNTLLDLAKNYAPQKYSQLVKGRNYNNQPVNLGEQLAREL
ncbi:MAG: ATP-dependent helicase, partial [Lactobacillus iners]|nr:ATP-dependent helicase [Lactobacillus iners]